MIVSDGGGGSSPPVSGAAIKVFADDIDKAASVFDSVGASAGWHPPMVAGGSEVSGAIAKIRVHVETAYANHPDKMGPMNSYLSDLEFALNAVYGYVAGVGTLLHDAANGWREVDTAVASQVSPTGVTYAPVTCSVGP